MSALRIVRVFLEALEHLLELHLHQQGLVRRQETAEENSLGFSVPGESVVHLQVGLQRVVFRYKLVRKVEHHVDVAVHRRRHLLVDRRSEREPWARAEATLLQQRSIRGHDLVAFALRKLAFPKHLCGLQIEGLLPIAVEHELRVEVRA